MTEPTPTTITLGAGQFLLEADLASILGGLTGGFLRITLCGFGPIIPWFIDLAHPLVPPLVLADAGVPQIVGPQGATALQVALFCNSFISPEGNFYEIAVLDKNKNVIQAGNYQFNIAGVTVNLATAPQIVGPYGFTLSNLHYLPCTGAVPGTVYTAPGRPIAVSFRGVFMPYGQSLPTFSYTTSGNVITLNFTTETGDRIDALVVA